MSEQIDVSRLYEDLEDIEQFAKAVSEKSGELRNTIKQKIEARGYHKKALGLLRQINAMSDEQLADFRLTFEPGYREVIGHRDNQPDMLQEAGLDDQPSVVPFMDRHEDHSA